MRIFQYHPEILARYPQIVGGAILAQDVTNGPTPVALQALYQAEQELVLQQIGSKPLSQLESLAAGGVLFVVLRWTRRSTARL